MKPKKHWISMALVLILCLCCLSRKNAKAVQNNNQNKTVKVSPKYARSRRMLSALNNRAVYKQLQQTVDLSSLKVQTTLSEAIELLRNSTEPPLKIVVMWRDLSDNANIDQDTTIQMDGVSGITLHTGLDILLRAVSSAYAKLGYIVKDGIIIVATKESLPVKMNTRVYDVSYLLSAPARFGFGFTPGFVGGFPGTLYTGRSGQFAANAGTDRTAYGQRRSRRGRGQERGGRRADSIAGIIRNTVRPNRWR
jgi:hypothetical protein